MKNLISSEMYKLQKTKSFKVCTIIGCCLALFTVVTFLLLSVAMNTLVEETGEDSEVVYETMAAEYESMGMVDIEIAMMTGIYDGEMILSMAFSQTSLQLFLAIFIAIFVAGEFSNGTIKILVSRGYSRAQVYFSKFLSSIISGNIMTLIIVAVATIGGIIVFGWHNPKTGDAATAGELIVFLLVQFALNTAISAMFVACSMMFKSLGASLAITIASYSFGSVIFLLLDELINAITQIMDYDVDKLPFMPSEVWIMQAVTNTSTLDLSTHDIILSLAVAAIYTAVFTLIGLQSFCKRDIK